MISNRRKQEEHYDSTRSSTWSACSAAPELLKGVEMPMPYFTPYQLVRQDVMNLFRKNPGMLALELGCGDGVWATFWAKEGINLTYLDLSSVCVQIAALRMKVNGLERNANPIVGSVTTLPCRDHSFDLIIGFGLIHHLTHDEEREFWFEVQRVLRPGGKAYFLESLQNSQLLEWMRTVVPIVQKHNPRPSRFSRSYAAYDQNDPHPRRENTTAHYREVLRTTNLGFHVEEIGILSRLDRLTTSRGVRSAVHSLDYHVFKHVPFIRFFGRNILIRVTAQQ